MPKLNESDIVSITKVDKDNYMVIYGCGDRIECCGINYDGELTKQEAILRLLLV